jgi:hypothetical protein
MALIALAAIELGALRMAGPYGVDACRFLTVAALAWATSLARVRKGEAGAFWFSFALAGWASYLLVIDSRGDRSLESLVAWIPLHLLDAVSPWSAITNNATAMERWREQVHILHDMMVLTVACLGGLAGWLTARRRRRSRDGGDL